MVVNEDRVPCLPRFVLERQRDQVPETASRHRVLTREETVVRLHAQLVPARHRFGDEIAAHLARDVRRHRRRKEEPDVGAVARSRSLHRGGKTDAPARLDERAYVVRPCALVEVHGEEPAGFVFEERVHTHHVTAREMPDDRGIVERDECLVEALAALHLWKLADTLDELVLARGRVARLAGLLAHEPGGEDLLAPPEQ